MSEQELIKIILQSSGDIMMTSDARHLAMLLMEAGYRKIDPSKLTVMGMDEMGDSSRSATTINDEKPRIGDYKYRWQAIAEAQLAHTKKELGYE